MVNVGCSRGVVCYASTLRSRRCGEAVGESTLCLEEEAASNGVISALRCVLCAKTQ